MNKTRALVDRIQLLPDPIFLFDTDMYWYLTQVNINFYCCLIGWSVKGERWGRGPSKPSSGPAVRASPGDWHSRLKWMKWRQHRQKQPVLVDDCSFHWDSCECLTDRQERHWTDLSTSDNDSGCVRGPYCILTNNCHWKIKHLKKPSLFVCCNYVMVCLHNSSSTALKNN